MVQHIKINVIHNVNRIKNKNYIITSIDTEKAFDKIQHPFMMKVLNKLEKEKFLSLIKNTTKAMVNINLNVKRLNAFSLRSGTK